MPKLSIITVNFNNAEGLARTIESVLAQHYTNLEFIIIDGNSTDSSVEIIEKHETAISKWVSELDNGVYHAMNKGIAMATGDYVLFLNSGDCLYQATVLQDNDVHFTGADLICFDINVVAKSSNFIKQHPDTLQFSYLFANTLAHQSTLIKRSLFDKVGHYDESLTIVSDWKFFIHATVFYRCTYKSVHQVLSSYNLDGMSATAEGTFKRRSERKMVLKNDFSLFLKDYKDLEKLDSNRFVMLNELENSKSAQKINSFVLRVLLKIFRGKSLKDLDAN